MAADDDLVADFTRRVIAAGVPPDTARQLERALRDQFGGQTYYIRKSGPQPPTVPAQTARVIPAPILRSSARRVWCTTKGRHGGRASAILRKC